METKPRIVHHRVWYNVGDKVFWRGKPSRLGTVEAIWTDHKISQEFAQVLWDDGSRDVVPTDQLEPEVKQLEFWSPEPSPRKTKAQYGELRKISTVDWIEINAMLENNVISSKKRKEYLEFMRSADVYGNKDLLLFTDGNKRIVFKSKKMIESF